MTKSRKTRIALVAAAALGLAGAVALPVASQAHGWGGPGVMSHGRHIDGRIAYLKAELKITPAQEAAWDAVAKAMHESSEALGKLRGEMVADKDKPISAVERLDRREKIAAAHAKSIAAFASAFKPLYDQLSDDQRKAADALFQPRFRRG
jgi:protein CpxP